jgi:enoyl-CoA hydratase/carnithine racemase
LDTKVDSQGQLISGFIQEAEEAKKLAHHYSQALTGLQTTLKMLLNKQDAQTSENLEHGIVDYVDQLCTKIADLTAELHDRTSSVKTLTIENQRLSGEECESASDYLRLQTQLERQLEKQQTL